MCIFNDTLPSTLAYSYPPVWKFWNRDSRFHIDPPQTPLPDPTHNGGTFGEQSTDMPRMRTETVPAVLWSRWQLRTDPCKVQCDAPA